MEGEQAMSDDLTMRQDDRVTSVTFTLPAGHKWTSVEAAMKEAHDREYELRMAFFWECQRLKADVERLTKAGDAMASWVGEDTHFWWGQPEAAVEAWNAAKEGKQP
jgi:hypothetical protein